MKSPTSKTSAMIDVIQDAIDKGTDITISMPEDDFYGRPIAILKGELLELVADEERCEINEAGQQISEIESLSSRWFLRIDRIHAICTESRKVDKEALNILLNSPT